MSDRCGMGRCMRWLLDANKVTGEAHVLPNACTDMHAPTCSSHPHRSQRKLPASCHYGLLIAHVPLASPPSETPQQPRPTGAALRVWVLEALQVRWMRVCTGHRAVLHAMHVWFHARLMALACALTEGACCCWTAVTTSDTCEASSDKPACILQGSECGQ